MTIEYKYALGEIVKDIESGFCGKVIAVATYKYDGTMYLVVNPKGEEKWFSRSRIYSTSTETPSV